MKKTFIIMGAILFGIALLIFRSVITTEWNSEVITGNVHQIYEGGV